MKFQKLTPNLVVRDVAASLEFYRSVLGFQTAITVPEQPPYVFGSVTAGGVEVFFNGQKHFITADRASGGHMLDCRTTDVTIKIHHTPEFELGTPGTEEFLKADLSHDHTAAIQKIER